MGVSYYVVGIKPADEKYNQMKTIYELCERANVSIPKEVREFFRETTPGARGLEIDLSDIEGPDPLVIKDTSKDDYRLTVDLRKLPEDIKILAFVVSC